MKIGEPKYVVTSPDLLQKIEKVADSAGHARKRILVLDQGSFPLSAADNCPSPAATPDSSRESWLGDQKCTDILDLLNHGESDWIRFDDELIARSTPAAKFCSSGTSGLPKAAVWNHFGLVCQQLSVEPSQPYKIRRLLSLPFFHVFAAVFAHVLLIRLGQPLFVLPRFHLEQFAKAVQRLEITDTLFAPPIVRLFNRASLRLREMFRTIRFIGVGGTPIDVSAMQLFHSNLHSTATLSQVWGMTEIGASMLLQYPEQDDGGSIGRPLPRYEARLV